MSLDLQSENESICVDACTSVPTVHLCNILQLRGGVDEWSSSRAGALENT